MSMSPKVTAPGPALSDRWRGSSVSRFIEKTPAGSRRTDCIRYATSAVRPCAVLNGAVRTASATETARFGARGWRRVRCSHPENSAWEDCRRFCPTAMADSSLVILNSRRASARVYAGISSCRSAPTWYSAAVDPDSRRQLGRRMKLPLVLRRVPVERGRQRIRDWPGRDGAKNGRWSMKRRAARPRRATSGRTPRRPGCRRSAGSRIGIRRTRGGDGVSSNAGARALDRRAVAHSGRGTPPRRSTPPRRIECGSRPGGRGALRSDSPGFPRTPNTIGTPLSPGMPP